MSLQISVVIPTYNSQHLLYQCLVSLEKQSIAASSFEVIVVDDGSSDGTSEMLLEFQKKTPLNLKSQYISNSGPATARNIGVQQAETEWIALLDADVVADSDWIKRALELIEQFPEVAGFEGRTIVSDRHKLTPFTHQTENFNGGRYPTCNMVIRKVFCRFYTKYRIPFREDTDLAFCILESGYTIHFDAQLKVYHPPLPPNFSRPIKLALRYYYDGLLQRRFPSYYKGNLDAHPFLGISLSHVKKKIYGLFLIGQILFLFGLVTQPLTSTLLLGLFAIFLTTYSLTCWMCFRPTMTQSRTLRDLLLLTLINLAVPWVIYFQLLKGYLHFRDEPPFDAKRWLKSLKLPHKKRPYQIVLISTADWDHPFWTNKQHVTTRLAERGHRILYVESLGLRQLTASYRDLKRIYQRTKRSLLWWRNLQPNVWVWSPLVLPFHRFAFIRRLNWIVLSACIRFFCRKLHFQSPLLWTYNPTVGSLIDRIEFSKNIYHCVDELKEAPGMPVELLETQEKGFCEKVDLIFTTSPELFKKRKQWNPNTYYLPNPCDFEHFNQATKNISIASDLKEIPQPRLGFIGALSHYKVSTKLLREIAECHPEWQLVLLGQVGEGEPGASFDELFTLPNVHFLGPKPYGELPHYLKGFQVSLLPCPINGYTESMFPLKFFEYLAAGVPVVTTALPALDDYRNICSWCSDHEEFIEAISRALEMDPELSRRVEQGIQLARENTWDKRVESMLRILDDYSDDSEERNDSYHSKTA
ncbi:MAG: glycosyltransferase [SAR324 cluster bacterium]|nr:glycosyltransferase [SAR324 cluster bacterium]